MITPPFSARRLFPSPAVAPLLSRRGKLRRADCAVTDALTKPIAIAHFPAQPTASSSRFTKLTDANACGGPVCGAELTTLLTESVDGLLFTSESDFPFEVLSLGTHGCRATAR